MWCVSISPKRLLVAKAISDEIDVDEMAILLKRRLHLKQDRKSDYKRKKGARSRKRFYGGKAMSITYSECVSVALVIQHAQRMRHIFLLYVACLASLYFFHIVSQTARLSEKKVIVHEMCVLIFSATFCSKHL
jgi:hypothetical protein